jgi:uncharacterized spore protein YtfJ
MGSVEVLDKLMSVTKAATVDAVFGKPEKVGEKLVIPVAMVRCCFGGGWGSGKMPGGEEASERQEGEGGGGGGAMLARPVAVLETTAKETKVIPIVDSTLIAVGGMLLGAAALCMIGRMVGKGKR